MTVAIVGEGVNEDAEAIVEEDVDDDNNYDEVVEDENDEQK